MALTARTTSNAASEVAAARQADHVAFLHRVPFAYDAHRLGFLTGFREDCTYQQQHFKALELPVGMLDNDFRNPDLDRYVERFFEHEPQVGVIGDAYGIEEVDRYVAAAREIKGSYPEPDLVIVPKCRGAIHAIPDDLVVGYSRDTPTDLLTSSQSRAIGVVVASTYLEEVRRNNWTSLSSLPVPR